VPLSGRGCMDLRLGAKEQTEFDAWLREIEGSGLEESRKQKVESRNAETAENGAKADGRIEKVERRGDGGKKAGKDAGAPRVFK